MSTGMPELGSKISLISKADIRYEGRLFTVDPQECTIALASVRSFGTEDRETQYPVAPQNQVYDYILFRGSDIKDIRVVNSNVSTLPNDPAIMQLSVPPSLGQQTYQPQGFSHPVLGPMGPAMGQYNNPYGGLGAMSALPSALAPGMGIARDLRNLTNKQQQQSTSVLDLIGGGSRSTTPVSLISRKSPTNDQGVQAGGAKDDKKTVQRPIQPPRGGGQVRERKESRGEHDPRQQQQNHQQHQQNQRNLQQQQHHPQQRPSQHQQHHQQQNHHPQQQQQQQQHQHQQQQQQHQQQQNRGGWINRGQNNNNMRQRGRGRGGQGMFRPPQGAPNPGGAANKGKTLKFENDYDFEQANTEFEELRSQLAKVKIAEVEPVAKATVVPVVAEVNGDSEKKDDSGNETGAGEGEHEEDTEIYYDKAKSFFDNISCEAVERSKGRSQRTDWRTERKLNSETFGVSSTRRGGYRGRGGYYNRGMYRGGYRGNYRGQGQQHHQQQQQHQQHHQQQQRNQNNTRQNNPGMPMREMQAPVVPSQPPPVIAAAGK